MSDVKCRVGGEAGEVLEATWVDNATIICDPTIAEPVRMPRPACPLRLPPALVSASRRPLPKFATSSAWLQTVANRGVGAELGVQVSIDGGRQTFTTQHRFSEFLMLHELL